MNEFSILIGGRAGEGINQAGTLIGRLLSRLGYRIYIHLDYPSLIRGGHNYALVRAAEDGISAHRDRIDFLIALNGETVDLHRSRTHPGAVTLFDSDATSAAGIGVPASSIVSSAGAPPITRNTCMIGAFAAAAGIPLETLEDLIRLHIPRETDLNLAVAAAGYRAAAASRPIPRISAPALPLMTGNEAIALGMAAAGLDAYVAYPMTPASGVLHFLAANAARLGMTVIHPESELAAVAMAAGFAYAGDRAAVGTSGGGFCLMTEGIGMAAMAETPVTVVLGQRPGPSTGVPTATAQTELLFALHAGQGEFVRFVAAPADARQAWEWSAAAVELASAFQIPSIVLADKTLCEGTFSVDPAGLGPPPRIALPDARADGPYRRYRETPSGVSPALRLPAAGSAVKANSYEHDEDGLTTEDPAAVAAMQRKRLRKADALRAAIAPLRPVRAAGDPDGPTALVCWGSNAGVCAEAAGAGVRVVQPVVLSPFPAAEMSAALAGARRVVCVENNAEGQLAGLLAAGGTAVDDRVLRYDGRPFSVEELAGRLAETGAA